MCPVNVSNAGQVNLADTSDADVVVPVVPNVSQGFVDTVNVPVVPGPSNVPTTPQAPVEPQTPTDETQTPKVEEGSPDATINRLKQQSAKDHKLLRALGVDPASDMSEQLESGVITEADVQRHVSSKYQVPTANQVPQVNAPDNSPVAMAIKEQAAALEQYNKEISENQGVSLETNQRLREADLNLSDAKLENLTRQITAKNEVQQANENVESVLSVARENPELVNMDEVLQTSFEQVSLALTGSLADKKAREMGINPATLDANQYRYFSGEAQKMLGGLAEYYRNLGRMEAKPNLQPVPIPGSNNVVTPMPVVVPAGADGTPIPAANPYAGVNVENHLQAAKDFTNKLQPTL